MKELIKSANMGIRVADEPQHNHKYAEIFISIGGSAVNDINGNYSETVPLDVYVLTEDMMHGFAHTVKYKYCIFKFNMDVLLERAGELLALPAFRSLFILEPDLHRAGLEVPNMQISPEVAEYAMSTAIILEHESDPFLRDTMFFSLVTLISKKARPRSLKESHDGYGRIAEIASYIESHYSEELTLESLSDTAGYSKRHFTRLFREYYRMSVMEYITERRLRRAAELLASRGIAVARVAEVCGFASAGALSKCFRARYGISPTEYRKRSTVREADGNLFSSAALKQ